MMFPKLFVTDLDGTALGGDYKPYARFPDHFSDFLDYLYDNGCQWAINTTWDAGGQWDLVEHSKVKSKPAFFMAEFGLKVATYTPDGPKMIQPYTEKMEAELLNVQRKVMSAIIRDISSRFDSKVMHFFGHLFSFAVIEEQKQKFKDYIAKHYSNVEELNIDCNDGQLGIYPKFMNKGVALAEVMKQMALMPENILVAGDELTDVAMMQPNLSKFAICPQNAFAKVKEHVIDMGGKVGCYHSSHGIIDAFQKLYKLDLKL